MASSFVLDGAYSLPPPRRFAQFCQDIPLGWHKALEISEEVILNCAVVTVPRHRGCRVKRHIEEIVHTLFAGLTACFFGSLLVHCDAAKVSECRRQISANLQMSASLTGVMSNLPHVAALLPEAGV